MRVASVSACVIFPQFSLISSHCTLIRKLVTRSHRLCNRLHLQICPPGCLCRCVLKLIYLSRSVFLSSESISILLVYARSIFSCCIVIDLRTILFYAFFNSIFRYIAEDKISIVTSVISIAKKDTGQSTADIVT